MSGGGDRGISLGKSGEKVLKKKKIIIICIILFLVFALLCVLILQKNIKITPFFAAKYELNGIDVSHYQGDIDWGKIEEQGIRGILWR